MKATLEIDVPVRAVLDHQTAGAFAAVVEAALIADLAELTDVTAETPDAAVATV